MLSVPSGAALADCVVLIHGLGRTSASMEPVGEFFRERGYSVVNTAYSSRSATIEELSQSTVEGGVNQCHKDAVVHFVTHSMGGILLRYYLEDHNLERLGRVVMLAPPNQGSEVVDNLRDVPGYKEILGPAGIQLGTDEDSIPSQLGPVRFELGVIAGTRTSNPILSQYLPNPDDGKVSVESTRVEGMTDFIEVPHSHPFMMTMPGVLEQIVVFIEEGSFSEYAD
jgi:triacylglycerol lipase